MEFFYSLIQDILSFSQDNYFISILAFFFFLICYSAFSLPGLLIFTCMSGYLFGIYYGFIVSILSVTIGSLIFFILSKNFFKYFFIKYYEKYAQNINKFISHSSLEYLIIFRLVPGLPLMAQNITLSLLDIPKFKFLLATFIGFTPIFFTSVIIGSRIKNIQLIKGITGQDLFTWDIVLIISVLILFLILKIKFKKNN
ncbi:MAG: VTT domain-containing protein [Pelagibacteraceae bacterium]|jgi:uncharacterized membrane protein YdjX (TVP38/TMEM64 family)|nr:VTT domain-containing protein [Pelagibacteraceae bacterium]MBO6470451.1 VTT domain-containing protein [Pelagibacteraceae bacterium]MBO6470833.1 VTT domain-containing protein [Pelagibacteraceae bacterium]MBO6478807.1 VTT domain-containing protein [Pelagibacteraceae bacterium]HJO13866.1 VTT domain-containing protein [Alphaproteobacteria bacterium]|tara:strand:- start:211 stop:804 length:594 start_codon:yes stop_codon:yes gene_type:complete